MLCSATGSVYLDPCSRLETNPHPTPASLCSATPFPSLLGWLSCASAAGPRLLQPGSCLRVAPMKACVCEMCLFNFPYRFFRLSLVHSHSTVPFLLREKRTGNAQHPHSRCGSGRAVGVTALSGYNP